MLAGIPWNEQHQVPGSSRHPVRFSHWFLWLGYVFYLFFFFLLSTEVRGSCARNVLGISTLRSRVDGSSCRGAAEMLAPGFARSAPSLISLPKRARWDSSSSEAPSEAWWGRTCGGWKAERGASGAGELRLGSEK